MVTKEETIEKIQDGLIPIMGDKLPELCNELVERLDEYSKEKGVSQDSVFDASDFMRWLESNHYDWLRKV